jgi:hypothetical protein
MYVSARYAPPDATGLMPDPEPGKKPVIATDDRQVEWHLTEDSQVGDWLRFKESESFAILAHDEAPEEDDDEPEPTPTKKRR